MPSGVATESDDGVPMGDGVTCARAGCAIASVIAVRIESCFIRISLSTGAINRGFGSSRSGSDR
jgi:hypothetical protein